MHFSRIKNVPAWVSFPSRKLQRVVLMCSPTSCLTYYWNVLKIERMRSPTNARMAQIATRPRGLKRTLDATITRNNVIGV